MCEILNIKFCSKACENIKDSLPEDLIFNIPTRTERVNIGPVPPKCE